MIYKFVGNEPDNFTSVAPDFRSDTEQLHSPLSIHNTDDDPEVRTARMLADEMVNLSGAEVTIYLRTDNPNYDRVWDEDPDPTYWNPIGLKGFFKPDEFQLELKKWGADSVNKTEINFSHRQIFELTGHRMLRAGDVIKIPYNAATESLCPEYYRVINGTPTGNYKYHWLYYSCKIESLTADATVRTIDDKSMVEDIQDSGDVYRESL